MGRPNDDVGALLQEYADLLSITGGEAFKVRVYERAARAISGHHEDVSTLDAAALRKIPNVGTSIADKVVEYLRTGRIPAVDELRASIPAGVRELTAIPMLGPKKALLLHELLGVSTIAELVDALDAEQLRDLKGFGPKTEERIRQGIELLQRSSGRVRINVAMELAEDMVAALRGVPGCADCTYAGSLRRMRETIGDVDILAAAPDSADLMAAFAALPMVTEVIVGGPKKTSVRTTSGLQVDLRVVEPASWGAALQYFTGSKAHNIRTRERAVHNGLKLSEYGLFEVESGELIVSRTEDEVYARLGLPWVPPELRDELPELVSEKDIRGDLHTHTTLTDGVSTLEDMVEAAARRGYDYYAVTDHAPNLVIQRMTEEKMLTQRKAIRALQPSYPGMRLLHGTELNIDPDGAVDWPAEFLRVFDICVASVHSHFDQNRPAMTRRFIRACENPHVTIIGHPTTRKIGRRPPVDVDLDEVFKACARTGTALEINSHPNRLDLPDEHILRARHHGVKFAINTDAHAVGHLGLLRYGIGIARRGWLTPDDVINTWPLERLRAFAKGR